MKSDLVNIENILKEDARIYSFDVFDTVLTRGTGTPEGIFHVMQEKLSKLSHNLPLQFSEEFCRWRSSAAKQARHTLKKECNIHDIYNYLQKQFHFTNDSLEELVQLEENVEVELARPISRIIRILHELHKRQRRVIFVSDMYLPKNTIRKMLKKVGAYFEGNNIYVSHESGKTKKYGDLYPHVLQQENCAPGQMLHIGDNKRADYFSASKIGIRSLLLSETRKSRYEKILLRKNSNSNAPRILQEKLSGAARQARLNRPEGKKHAQTLHQIGANIAGPILLFYVKWILQEAERNNLRRLYFLARDGQILLDVAQKIKKSSGFTGELRYLYASRQALYLPATTKIDDHIINWILLRRQFLSLEMIAKRTGLEVQFLQEELNNLSGRAFSYDYQFRNNDLGLLKKFLKMPSVEEAILTQAKELRSNVRHYLEQEGLFDDIPYGVVDLGVKGTLQDCIKEILVMYSPNRECDLFGFYFGVNRFGKVSGMYKRKFGYIFAPNCEQKFCPVSFSATRIMEIFTTGDHGLTVAYTLQKNGKWGPKLKETANTDILQWGLNDLRLGIKAFLDAFISFGETSVKSLDPHEQKVSIISLLNQITHQPNLDEAEAIGSHPFKNDPGEFYTVTFAPAFDFKMLLAHIKALRNSEITSWLEGTYLRSPLTIRCLLEPLRIVTLIMEWCKKVVIFLNSKKFLSIRTGKVD